MTFVRLRYDKAKSPKGGTKGTGARSVRLSAMDILQNRKALGGVGMALGFSLLVAWMVPPTEPRPPAPSWRAHIRPVAPPAPVDFAGFAPAMAAMPAYPVEHYAYAEDTTADTDVAVYRGGSGEDLSSPVTLASPVTYAPVDRDDFATPPVSGYGHRWTEDAGANEPAVGDRWGRGDDAAPAYDDVLPPD